MSPAETILEHLPKVREAFAQSPGPSAAWSRLQGTCPDLTESMSLNTFRVLAPAVLLTAERLHSHCVTASVSTPKTFLGWSVQTDCKGYTRLHKRFKGKVLSVYVGKAWDPDKAKERIDALVLD